MTIAPSADAADFCTSNTRSSQVSVFFVLIVLCAVLVSIWLRFSSWIPTALYGDDLNYFVEFTRGTCATQAKDILTSVCQERFRPIASAAVISEMALFGTRMHLYIVVNALIIALTSLVIFLICMRLSGGRKAASLFIACTVATSRFAAYHFTQILAPVESLTLLFCLSTVYCYLRLEDDENRHYRWALLAILFAAMAAFTHERTLVIAAWLVLAFVFSPKLRNASRSKLAGLILLSFCLPVFYISYKVLVLNTEFMVGTGGTHLSIDYGLIALHAKEAVMSLLGFNQGPEYLVGAPVTPRWTSAFALAVMLTIMWCSIFFIGVYSALRGANDFSRKLEALRWPFLIAALLAATLMPTLLTIRLEQRWLLIPFALLMLVPAWALGVARPNLRSVVYFLVLVLSLSSIALDTLVSRHFGNLFFISSMRYAAVMKEDLAEATAPGSDTIALLAGGEHCQWTLGGGAFFSVYTGQPRLLRCFASLDEEATATLPPKTRVFGIDSEKGLVDLTEESHALQLASAGTIEDFIQSFSDGHIDDETPVSSPSGRGAFVMPWASKTGTQNTLTVISGYEYIYDDIQIPAGGSSYLILGMSMTYPSEAAARATIRVVAPDVPAAEQIVIPHELMPPDAEGQLRFVSSSIPLQRFEGQKVSISFRVDSPHGNPNGHWIAFSSPRIVMKH